MHHASQLHANDKHFLDLPANAFYNLFSAPTLSENALQYFNLFSEVRLERSKFYISGTSISTNTWASCCVTLPSTILMPSISFPEAPLFEDYTKGKLVWKQHVLYVEYGQNEKEIKTNILKLNAKEKIILCFLFIYSEATQFRKDRCQPHSQP